MWNRGIGAIWAKERGIEIGGEKRKNGSIGEKRDWRGGGKEEMEREIGLGEREGER